MKTKRRFRTRWMRWMALGTMAAYSTTALRLEAVAQEQHTPHHGGSAGHEEQLPVRRYEIAPGALEEVLTKFSAASGISVLLDLPVGTAAGFRSQGVVGLYSAPVALRTLLEGTGLSGEFHGPGKARIGIRHSESVEVSSPLPDSLSMDKFTAPLLETPQTVNVVPSYLMQEQGTSTLRDSLRNVPGISLAAGEGGSQGDNLTIRGFTARNDLFLDGIRDFGSYYRDSFDYEQVDVLEGPAGVQFGRGSTGGVINQESKHPQADPFVRVNAQFGTDLTRRMTVDINHPLDDVAEGASLRLNAMATEAGVAGRPYAENRRFGLAPSIEFGLNSPTRFSLSYFHLTESDTPDYGLPWLNNKLVQGVNRHSYFGFPDENYLRTNDDVLTARFEHDFGTRAELHSLARWANYPRSAQITEPQICSNPSASVPVGGYVTALPTSAINTAVSCSYNGSSDPATILVNRNQIQTKSVEGILWDQTEATIHLHLLHMVHALVAGVEGGQEISNPIRTGYTISKVNTVPYATLLRPNAAQPFAGTGYITSVTHTKSDSVGLYFLDTIKLGRLFELSGGIRWDRFDTGYNLWAPTPPAGGSVSAAVAPISRVDEQPTYRAAIVYKPNGHGSVYFDYGTSFNPAAESLSLSATLANSAGLKSEENESFEGGTKWSLYGDRLMLEFSAFRTEKDNAREPSPTDSTLTVNAGDQLVRGLQGSVVGRLPEGLDIVLGYAYLDSKVLASAAYPNAVGYPLANVPKQTFNFFLTHRLPWLLNIGLGGNYVAARTASSTTPYVPTSYSGLVTIPGGGGKTGYQVLSTAMKQVPGYWVFNAMASRPVTSRLELQANLYNLLNRFYIDEPHPSHLVPGAGLSALIGFNYKF